jgi:hypothetical protein
VTKKNKRGLNSNDVNNESEQNGYWVEFQSKKLKMLEEELKLEKEIYDLKMKRKQLND